MTKGILAVALAAAFLAATAATHPASSQNLPAATGAPAKSSKAVSGRDAMHARQKQCGTEWKAAKAAGTVQKSMTWPKYWSACNKRLKSAQG